MTLMLTWRNYSSHMRSCKSCYTNLNIHVHKHTFIHVQMLQRVVLRTTLYCKRSIYLSFFPFYSWWSEVGVGASQPPTPPPFSPLLPQPPPPTERQETAANSSMSCHICHQLFFWGLKLVFEAIDTNLNLILEIEIFLVIEIHCCTLYDSRI